MIRKKRLKESKALPEIIGTGLSGLIGSRIVELLSPKFRFIDFSLDSGVDITDFKALNQKFKEHDQAKTVLHLAGFTDVDAAWKENGDRNGLCYRINVLGTENIAKLCRRYNKYLIHFSTDFVFNGRKKTFYTEYDQPDPIEWYSVTKAEAEKKVKKSGCRYLIIRTAFPFKAKPSPKKFEPKVKVDLVRKMISAFKRGEKVYAFGDQIITPTFIDDLAKALKKIIEKRRRGILHIVGSTPLSPYELACQVAMTFGFPENMIEKTCLTDYLKIPDCRPRQRYLAISNRKLHDKLGIRPLPIRRALHRMLRQLKS